MVKLQGVFQMRRAFSFGLAGLAGLVLLTTVALAAGHNASDYPLRVHIYEHNGHSHYYQGQSLEYVDGEGRANLFENGAPRGFDFGYRCGDRLNNSPGYETYLARWKKQGQTLEILLPVMGKPGAYDVCELKVIMKDTAYYKHSGLLNEEPAAKYKEWMEKTQYDPEKGKNEPVKAPAAPAPASGADPQQ